MASHTPIPIVLIGRLREVGVRLSSALAPQYNVLAVIAGWETGNPKWHDKLCTLFETLIPRPVGLVVGGGLNEAVQKDATAVVERWNQAKAMRDREDWPEVKVICVPIGLLREKGQEELLKWCKAALDDTFQSQA